MGVNRLITSLNEAGIGPGSNVYGELGSTWYQIMAHPQEASHVMGKLLKYLGEDNILWGTDCPFYGPPQPMIDAFRPSRFPMKFATNMAIPAYRYGQGEDIGPERRPHLWHGPREDEGPGAQRRTGLG